MPLLDNPALDDPLILDGNLSFVGGQFSYAEADIVPENGFHIAHNMDYDAIGGIVSRRGADQLVGNVWTGLWEEQTANWETYAQLWSATFTAPVRDIFYFDTTAAEFIVVADGDNVIKFASETAAIQTVASATYSTENVYFAQLTDKLYFCDGAGSLAYITSTPAFTSITSGRITSVDVTNSGSGYTAAPVITVTGTGAGAVLAANLGPGGTIASISITTAGTGYGSGTIISIAAPASGVTATALPRISRTPTTPKFLISHTSRLFCATNASGFSDTVYASDILDGESWDTISNSVRVGGGDGDPIMALFPWYGFKLLVFKERSVWVIEANPSLAVSDWTVELVSSRIGCVAHKTVQQVGSDVFFLSREGVQSLATIENGAQTGISIPISAPVQDVIDLINPLYYSRCSAVYYRNRYLISFPTITSTIDTTLVYSSLVKSWAGTWDGWKPRAYAMTAFGGKIRLSFGDEDGKLFTWLDYLTDGTVTESDFLDQGVSYQSRVITKSYGFNDKYSDKFGYQVQFGLDNIFDNVQEVNFLSLLNLPPRGICISAEDGVSGLLTESGNCIISEFIINLGGVVEIPSNTGLFRKSFNLQSVGRFAEIQFVVTADSGRLSLHNVKSSAFADTIRPEL